MFFLNMFFLGIGISTIPEKNTNAFSKKIENHIAHLTLHYMYYNFARIHKTLRVTPAMEAMVSDYVWNINEIILLLDK